MKNAYEEGRHDSKIGMERSDNPYREGTQPYNDWLRGFNDDDEEYNDQ